MRFCVALGRLAMINKLKIATAAALVAAGVASPAFAQSADHTGSQMPYYYDSTGKQMWGNWGPQETASNTRAATRSDRHVAARRSGSSAFAMVPGTASSSFGPGAAGGGSIGYNENLRIDQW
jgi:hypothetical protein